MKGRQPSITLAHSSSALPRPWVEDIKTVFPGVGGISTVIDGSGVHTEMQVGNMRQMLGKNGFD